VRAIGDLWPTELPTALEATEGASQCSYELLRAFASYARRKQLRYTLGAGTLLGAMRNQPPGLLQWEHDVDVYMPARDASELIQLLKGDCLSHRRRVRECNMLHFVGLADRDGQPCCGWGFKLFHAHSAACELDVLVLAASHAPFMHGETPLWPLWSLPLAWPYHALAVAWRRLVVRLSPCGGGSSGECGGGVYYVIPEDVRRKSLMSDLTRWCALPLLHCNGHSSCDSPAPVEAEWAWCGEPLSYFQDEHFAPGELFPLASHAFHEMRLAVPHAPWALLNRTYGNDVGYIARLNEHAGARADLRLPEHKQLLTPARVRRSRWWRTHTPRETCRRRSVT